MKRVTPQIQSLPAFQSLVEGLTGDSAPESLGLSRAARLPALAALHQTLNRPLLLLTQKTGHALTLADELALWAPDAPALYFPEPTALFYENAPWGENTRRQRLLALTTLSAAMIPGLPKPEVPPIVIAPARAVMARIMPRREFVKATRSLKPGQTHAPVKLTQSWVQKGYQTAHTVVVPGQFARRGGILDIWPPADDYPTRIEFFGDQLEGFRHFDPATQRTVSTHERLLVPPAREFLIDPENSSPEPGEEWTEFHLPLLHAAPGSPLDYLPTDTLVLFDDFDAFQATVDQFEEQALSLRSETLAEGAINEDHPLPYITLGEMHDSLSRFQTLELGPSGAAAASELALSFSPNQRFGGQLKTLIEHIKKMGALGDDVIVVSRQAARLKDLWEQNLFRENEAAPTFIQGSLGDGWLLTPPGGARLHLLTDGEIFGWRRPQPRQRPRVQTAAPEGDYLGFQLNDFVVHVDHGIGRYQGLVIRQIEGIEHEYLCLQYAEGDQLYVPVHQADRVTRYVGARGHRPSVSRLSGAEWSRVKTRVKQAVQQIAEDLLELYAQRQIAGGHAFSPDTPWQKELEASFPYIETQDQLQVLEEVKGDMEQQRPMDRLICGDVGYGKTEIALRAAFKAVMDGRQVAMLVPTTILAQQHYRTFRQRLAAFPAEVEMLSRFRTPAEQREILYRLTQGAVDIIIGTHRLIQPDVVFKDLGLAIIDEEQRFGVTHKEHLKQLRTEIDVLTMTATPIPRTLYMTLTGVRDISTINTPPEERLPIVTHVGPYEARLVRQAILRELDRGGQVFFVHNRVQTIAGVQNQVKRLVPEARFAIAHGQMAEKELAQRMREFNNGEIDVLISTSIIESGLDIPNANTLIVDRADAFGLAQLYQLRGRVGRGAQRAYAYFFKHRTRPASEEGKMRLETLAENTQLGAGFSIAMRDLEIRGAGDFLGTRQHGHIAAVGLNLYTKLLTQAVEQIKSSGVFSADAIPASLISYHPLINVDLPLLVTIPPEYVPGKDMRLSLYRRLADIHDLEALAAIETEFGDRFGPPPEPVHNLLFQLKVRLLAEKAGASSVAVENELLAIRFPTLPEDAPPRSYPNLGKGIRTGKNALWLVLNQVEDWQSRLVEILETLAARLGNPSG